MPHKLSSFFQDQQILTQQHIGLHLLKRKTGDHNIKLIIQLGIDTNIVYGELYVYMQDLRQESHPIYHRQALLSQHLPSLHSKNSISTKAVLPLVKTFLP